MGSQRSLGQERWGIILAGSSRPWRASAIDQPGLKTRRSCPRERLPSTDPPWAITAPARAENRQGAISCSGAAIGDHQMEARKFLDGSKEMGQSSYPASAHPDECAGGVHDAPGGNPASAGV